MIPYTRSVRSVAWPLAAVVILGCSEGPAVVQHLDRITAPGMHIRYPSVDGFSRSYALYVPESVDFFGAPVPAIMVLHGFPPVDMATVTAMSEAADRSGFIAVYPKANAGAEWAMACDRCSPNAAAGVDDIEYFRAVVAALPEILPVDPGRIYMTGFSNGGIMTYRAACVLSNEIAAFAPNGAGIWTWHRDNCSPGRDVPILMINGTDDPSFPWEGVAVSAPLVGGDVQLPVLETVALWADKNGCGENPSIAELPDAFDDGTTVERWSFSGCGAETLFYRIDGGGHTWPGGPVEFNPVLGVKSLELAATDSIVAFFLRQGR